MEGAVGHPDVLDPQPAFVGLYAGGQKLQTLGGQLVVGHHAHGVEHDNQNRHGQDHGKAAAHGVDAFLAVKLGHLLVELFLVVFILLLQLGHLRLQVGHAAHTLAALVVQRHDDQFEQKRKNDHRPAVIADDRVDTIQDSGEKFIHRGLFPPYRGVQSLRNGVVAAFAERIAAQNAPQSQPAPLPRAETFDGRQGVLRAGGRKTAAWGIGRTDPPLVEADSGDHEPGDHLPASRFRALSSFFSSVSTCALIS